MSDETIEYSTKGLDQLLKALKANASSVRVGILGTGKNTRKDGGPTNAEIGAKYEFKTDPKMAGGSFLRQPITEQMQKYLDKSGAFDRPALAAVIKQGSLIPWLQKLGILAEEIVQDGFASGGFGKWTPSQMAHKKVQQTLVETQQLRNSITSEVK